MLALTLNRMIRVLPAPSRRWPSLVALLCGVLAGSILILRWLTDPAPSENWTQPEPHMMTGAGWYHAAFLVGASGYFSYLWIEYLRRLRGASRDSPSLIGSRVAGSGCSALALGASLGYVVLAGHDSAQAGDTGAGQASLIALALATIALCAAYVWALRGDLASLSIVAPAVSFAGGFGLLVVCLQNS